MVLYPHGTFHWRKEPNDFPLKSQLFQKVYSGRHTNQAKTFISNVEEMLLNASESASGGAALPGSACLCRERGGRTAPHAGGVSQ